jgi:FkbM family methyltransferase
MAFEPSSREYGRLVEHLRLNQLTNVNARRSALGAEDGRRVLQVADAHYSGLNTLGTRFGYDGIPTAAREEVAVTTIDAVVAREELPRLDLIKLDVEGAEFDVVEGARRTIGRFRPALVFEANATALAAQGRSLDALDRAIRAWDYRLFAINDDGTLRPQAHVDASSENFVALAPGAGKL